MKKLFALALVAGMSIAPSFAQAQITVDADARVNVGGNSADHRQNESTSSPATGSSRNTASVTASSSVESHGEVTADEHKSSVATFVASLLSVADRDSGIGADVRAVAKSQQDSASTTAEAMAKVEARSKALTFLIGTDWKNLGMVRSAAAKSEADLKRLEAAHEKAASASVRADLEAQIDVLKHEQEHLASFVAENESAFSLFGWFTKLFVNVGA